MRDYDGFMTGMTSFSSLYFLYLMVSMGQRCVFFLSLLLSTF